MAIGDLVPRADDSVLMFSRSTRRVYPGTLPDPVAPGLGGHVIQDEGVARAQTGILNFVGKAIGATEAGTATNVTTAANIMIFRGLYVSNSIYQRWDVATAHSAHWCWTGPDVIQGVSPGTSDARWVLAGGTPQMNDATFALWTAPNMGETCYRTDQMGLWVYGVVTGDATLKWRPTNAARNGGNIAHNLYTTPVNDGTARTLADYTVQSAKCVLQVVGRIDFVLTATSSTEIRCTTATFQSNGTTLVSQPAASIQRWFGSANQTAYINYGVMVGASAGERLIVTMHRAAGTGTYTVSLSDYRFNGLTVVELPLTP